MIYIPGILLIHSVPQPTVTIIAKQPDTLDIGSSITLTCFAKLDSQINAFGSLSISWGGPRIIIGEKPYSMKESGFGLTYRSNLTMSDMESQDEGEYTCTVRVAGDTNILGAVRTESISVMVSGENYLFVE